jgi:hypothetical protein
MSLQKQNHRRPQTILPRLLIKARAGLLGQDIAEHILAAKKTKARDKNEMEERYGWENNRDVIRNKLLMEALLPAARKLII